MKIVIVGYGKIGKSLIANLVKEDHEVVVIDENQKKVSEAINIYDVIGVCGIGTDSVTLTEAGADKADIFIAVTGSDELNMLSCYIAKTLGAENTVARIRDRSYNENSLGFLQQKLGLSMSINPERFAAEDIYNVLKVPGAAHIETFSTRKFEIIELPLKEDSALHNMKVMDLRKQYKANFLFCAVQRGEDVFIPDGNFVLQSGDKIALTAPPTEIFKLLRALKITRKQARNIMILGGSRTAYYLAKMLLNSGNSVTIIDKDPVRCQELDEALPGATIILGDGARQEILLEEGLKNMDAFISLTGMDEENILLSYYATSQEVPKVITKINRTEFAAVAQRMGLDTLVSPRRSITDVIVRYARALQNAVGNNVEKIYKIMDGNAEALMFNVNSDFEYLDIPLKDISFKKNLLIVGILRNRKAIVPTGNDVIMAGDKVVVISKDYILYDLADIIA